MTFLHGEDSEAGECYIYKPNFEVVITPHRPPPPFGCPQYKHNAPMDSGPAPTSADTQLDYVSRIHPIATEEVLEPQQQQQQQAITLCIKSRLCSGEPDGAQAFVCRLTRPEVVGSERLFAKIYDPLYYRWPWTNIESSAFRHVVRHADMDYSREAAAYEHLRGGQRDSRLMPKYYGSWTFDLHSLDGNRHRPVRLILTEYIDGQTLYQAYYHKWVYQHGVGRVWIPPNKQPERPDELRLDILAKAVIVWTRQLGQGLNQKDFAPRNVIALLDEGKGNHPNMPSLKRVALIDYNISIVSNKIQRKPSNPLKDLWHGATIPEWEAWMPAWWMEDEVRRRMWLYRTFGGFDILKEYRDIELDNWKAIQDWWEAHGQA